MLHKRRQVTTELNPKSTLHLPVTEASDKAKMEVTMWYIYRYGNHFIRAIEKDLHNLFVFWNLVPFLRSLTKLNLLNFTEALLTLFRSNVCVIVEGYSICCVDFKGMRHII